jgi:hypothetical protein
MKARKFIPVVLSVLLFYSCNLFNNQNGATLIFKGVEKFPTVAAKAALTQYPESTADTYLMYSRDMEFDIKEIWITDAVIGNDLSVAPTWYLLGESEGLKSMSEYEFIAEDIPEGTYASLKIIFRNNALRHAVYVSDTLTVVEMAGSLNEADTSDTSSIINYFSPNGSFAEDSSGQIYPMAEGESFQPFTLRAGYTTTIYWKGGGPESVWTDFTFQWHDNDNDSAWTPTVDYVNNFEGPEDVPMWSFLIVEE